MLMNFCTSYGPLLRGATRSPDFFHRSTWCKMYRLATKVVLARTHSRVTVHVKTHSCLWTVSVGTSAMWTKDPPAQLCVSDTTVLNTKTQANAAGYNRFSMLLQYNTNIFTTYNSPLHRVFKCFWTMGSGSPAGGKNVKSWLIKSICE